MHYKWLQHLGADKLIIFFNGWGMDSSVVCEQDCEDYDVIVFYDYNDLNIEVDLSGYKERHVIAWSMGVMIADIIGFDNLKSAAAICGTPYMIDDDYGIAEKIYNLTVEGFDKNSLKKFMKRMFLTSQNVEIISSRSFESQKNELIKLLDYKPLGKIKYTRAIAADSDKIIPFKNQINYWKTPEIIHSGHYPFDLYKKWSELL